MNSIPMSYKMVVSKFQISSFGLEEAQRFGITDGCREANSCSTLNSFLMHYSGLIGLSDGHQLALVLDHVLLRILLRFEII